MMNQDKLANLQRLMEIKRLVQAYPYPALNDLDRKLKKYIDFKNGFFIECGANDGHNQSNTFHYEYLMDWKGILIEAIPHLAKTCAYRRMSSAVYNCALVSFDFEGETLPIRFAGLKSIAQGIKPPEVEEQWVTSGVRNENLPGTFTVDVPARTLTSILDEEKPERIDLFSLDVEGYEPEVLKGLDLDRYRPRYVLIEMHEAEAIEKIMSPYYDLAEELTKGWDLLYRARKPVCIPN
jgi:FkbM family methyltransferase